MTNYEHNDNPDELKEDIERTRNRMSEKINTIQERLDPDNLRHQAKDAVRDVMSDSADALMGYVKEYSRDISSTLVDTIKRHPVPTALIGFGIGWMLVERMTGSAHQNGGRNSQDHSYRNQSYQGSSSPQSVPVYDQYGRRQDRFGDANLGYPSSGQSQSYGQSYGGGQSQGGQFQSGQDYGAGDYRPSQGGSYGYGQGQGYGQEEQRGGVRGMMESAQETVEQIGDKVKQTAHDVQDAAGRVGDTVQNMASNVRDQSGRLTDQAQYVGAQAQYRASRTGEQIQESIETNPLIFGAVALAVGAAVGLMLPSTRRENEMLGEWRDEVVHRAQEVAGDVRERAQHVVEEVKPELQQTVEKVKSDLKQTGKEALEEMRSAASTAEAAVKEEIKPKGDASNSNPSNGNPSNVAINRGQGTTI